MSAMPNPTLVASADGRSMRVEHRGDDKFDINIRGHVVRVDQPVKDGGEDTGPTPTELFIASLASCVAFYARRYLARHDLPTDGLAVEATFEMGSRPARVAGIEVRLIVPEACRPSAWTRFWPSPATAPCTTRWTRRPRYRSPWPMLLRAPSRISLRAKRAHPRRSCRLPARLARAVKPGRAARRATAHSGYVLRPGPGLRLSRRHLSDRPAVVAHCCQV